VFALGINRRAANSAVAREAVEGHDRRRAALHGRRAVEPKVGLAILAAIGDALAAAVAGGSLAL